MRRETSDRDRSLPVNRHRRRPAALVLIDAHRELRDEASTWRMAPSRGAQLRADRLDHVADELRALLRRWH